MNKFCIKQFGKSIFSFAILLLSLIITLNAFGQDDLYWTTDENGNLVLTNYEDNSSTGKKYTIKRSTYTRAIRNAALKHNLDSNLLKAIISTESNFNRYAVSHKGAQGLMQLMPGTAKLMGVTDPYDPYQNIDGGARYLRNLLDTYDGNLELALAAYNAGPNTVDKYNGIPPYKETQNYVKIVKRKYGGNYLKLDGSKITSYFATEKTTIKKINSGGKTIFTNIPNLK